jgi:hypothetical protein
MSTIPEDRVEWGIDRLRRLVAPLELPSFMLAFWRAFPDSATWKVPVPFAAVYDKFNWCPPLPNVMVPIGSFEHTVVLLEIHYDNTGWVWEKGLEEDANYICWGPADQTLLVFAEVRDPQAMRHDRLEVPSDPASWPETWKREQLDPDRFSPPALTIAEFLAEPYVQVALVEAQLKIPSDGTEASRWLADDGTSTLWVDRDSQEMIDPWHSAFHGRPTPPRMDPRRIGPPIPGQLFRLQVARESSGEIKVRPYGYGLSDEERSEQRLLILRAERDSGSTALFGFVDPATPLETIEDMRNFFGQPIRSERARGLI